MRIRVVFAEDGYGVRSSKQWKEYDSLEKLRDWIFDCYYFFTSFVPVKQIHGVYFRHPNPCFPIDFEEYNDFFNLSDAKQSTFLAHADMIDADSQPGDILFHSFYGTQWRILRIEIDGGIEFESRGRKAPHISKRMRQVFKEWQEYREERAANHYVD